MKKLCLFAILLIVPFLFMGCFKKEKTPEAIGSVAFESFKNFEDYTCTLTYKKDGKDIVETCLRENILGYDYIFYTYAENGEVLKKYWLEDKVVAFIFEKIGNADTTFSTASTIDSALLEVTKNYELLMPERFNFSKEDFKNATLENTGYENYNLNLYDYVFKIKNKEITEINYDGKIAKYTQGKIADAEYLTVHTSFDEQEHKATFDDTIEKMIKLEELAEDYITQKGVDYTPYYLTLNYIRSGTPNYVGGNWKTLLGEINQTFASYVEENQGDTNISSLKDIDVLKHPYSTNEIDFPHLIAVVSFGEKFGINAQATDLGGFGGDIAQLTQEIKDVVESEEILEQANEKLFAESSSFGIYDFYADIEALNLIADLNKNKDLKLGDIFKNLYYNYDHSFVCARAFSLLNIEGKTKEIVTSKLVDRLESNFYITYWLSQNGVPLKTHREHFTACVTAFINRLYSNM